VHGVLKPMQHIATLLCLAALSLHTAAVSAAEQVIPISGEVPSDAARHFYLPFTVPPGIVEIEVQHDDLSDENILDWGLEDPNGFRGWGGGNTEPAIVGLDAASRSYLPGPIVPGEWRIVVGKAKILVTPALYEIKVVLRDTPTLAPQPERQPYHAPPPLVTGARWYAGDFHVHSVESGDARPPLDEIASFAKSRGLDFVLLSDHNTVSQLDFYAAVQKNHPQFLFLPGMEFTTYWGHANAIGSTQWVDHKLELPGNSIAAAAGAFRAQGALFSINHPTLELGDLCIGCAWSQDLSPELIDAIEIQTGNATKLSLFGDSAIELWDSLLDTGRHLAAIGGSDDHRAGLDLSAFQSPIGDPTTMVFAEELSVQGILDGVRKGRTVVKLVGPESPMIVLSSSVAPDGDTVSAKVTTFRAEVTGGMGHVVRFVVDGTALDEVEIATDPFVHTLTLEGLPDTELRCRAEALQSGKRRTVTSHLWLRHAEGAAPADAAEGDAGCSCRLAPGPLAAWTSALVALLGLGLARRRRRVAR
jgi:MYXO-CTERM domain-containing protein